MGTTRISSKKESITMATILLILFMLQTVSSQTAAACEYGVNCDYCCIATSAESPAVCVDDIIACKLSNKTSYFGALIFIYVIFGWCLVLPVIISCLKCTFFQELLFQMTIPEMVEAIFCKSCKKKDALWKSKEKEAADKLKAQAWWKKIRSYIKSARFKKSLPSANKASARSKNITWQGDHVFYK